MRFGPRLPIGAGLPAAFAGLAPLAENLGGNFEGRIAPAEVLARRRDLGLAQRCAVGGFRALVGGRPEADRGAAGDEGRLVAALRFRERRRDGDLVVAVDFDRVPLRRLEAL